MLKRSSSLKSRLHLQPIHSFTFFTSNKEKNSISKMPAQPHIHSICQPHSLMRAGPFVGRAMPSLEAVATIRVDLNVIKIYLSPDRCLESKQPAPHSADTRVAGMKRWMCCRLYGTIHCAALKSDALSRLFHPFSSVRAMVRRHNESAAGK